MNMPDLNAAVPRADMQAVVVIHGMGEQIPMDTIKNFVNAVWQNDVLSLPTGFPIRPRYGARCRLLANDYGDNSSFFFSQILPETNVAIYQAADLLFLCTLFHGYTP
jgi:hypothetical protein